MATNGKKFKKRPVTTTKVKPKQKVEKEQVFKKHGILPIKLYNTAKAKIIHIRGKIIKKENKDAKS